MAVKNNALRVSYGQTQGLINVFNPPIVASRAPLTTDFAPLGQIWVNKLLGNGYCLTRILNNQATWVALSAAVGGPLTQLTTVDDGMVVLPAAGNINIDGDNANIAVTNTAPNTIGVSLVNSPVIAGNLTVTGLLTANGGEVIVGALTQTAGNISLNADAAGATIAIGTGAAAKLITIGSASGASSLNLLSGTGDITATSTDAITMISGGIATFSSIDNAAGAVTIRTNGGAAETIVINSVQGTGDASVNISSTAGGISVTGAKATATALNLIASNAAGGLTSTVGTGGYSFTAANGIFTANTGTGIATISGDATANTINIATGAGVKLLTLGSTNTTSNTVVRSGSAGVNVNVSNNQPTNVNTGTSTGTISIGNALTTALNVIAPTNINLTGALNTSIGSTSNTGTITIGNVASTAIDINGATFINANIAANTAINTGISTGTVTIGTVANAGAVSINSSAASNFSVAGAGVDLSLNSTLGSVIIAATEVAADAIQLTTAATGGITVNASSAAMLVHRAVNVDAAAGINAFTSTSLTTGVAGVFTSSAATIDAVQLVGGGLKVAPVVPASGASPRVASGRFGVASFTNNVAAAATVALAITNTMATATSHIIATVQCVTAGSACVIRNLDVSVAGTITCNVTNLGGTDTGAGATIITFWLLD